MKARQFKHCNCSISSGFSLIELLVAMTLLIMVTLIGTYGYNLYAQYWKKELGHYQSTFRLIKDITQIHNLVKDIKPYVLKGGEKGAFFYFEGGQKIMRSVVAHALSNPNYPALFELELVQLYGVNHLVYRENVMDKLAVTSESQINAYPFEITLLSGFSDLTFEYYGWPSYQERAEFLASDGSNLDVREWYGFYSGKDTLITPDVVRISVVDESEQLSVLELPVPQIIEDHLESYLIDE